MSGKQRYEGLTPFEALVAVVLLAILALAIAPPLVRNINEGRIARAEKDALLIADSILRFHEDTGFWPLQNDGDIDRDVTRLATNAGIGGGNHGIPGGADEVPGGGNWNSWGEASTVTDQLILNATRRTAPLYAESGNPRVQPGWNGPYLDSAPLDPWENPFVVNIRYMDTGVDGYARHAVMVLSAGPNEVFETPFHDATCEETIGGDDVGCILRPVEQQ